MNRPGDRVPKLGKYFCDNCGKDPWLAEGSIFPPCPTDGCGEETTYSLQLPENPDDVEDPSDIKF